MKYFTEINTAEAANINAETNRALEMIAERKGEVVSMTSSSCFAPAGQNGEKEVVIVTIAILYKSAN